MPFSSEKLVLLSISSSSGTNGVYFYNMIFKKLGINGIYINYPTPVLEGLKKTFAVLRVHAASIASPFKQSVIPLLDEISEIARITGSVNSVKRVDGKLFGHNTDELGLRHVLSEYLDQKISPDVAIYGSGGVVPSIVSAIRALSPKANISLSSRNQSTGKLICTRLGLTYSGHPSKENVDLWINATPASISCPDEIADLSKKANIVFDLVPMQVHYPFEKIICNRGQIMIRGFDFYREQFLEQYKFYFDCGLERHIFDNLAQDRPL